MFAGAGTGAGIGLLSYSLLKSLIFKQIPLLSREILNLIKIFVILRFQIVQLKLSFSLFLLLKIQSAQKLCFQSIETLF